MNTREVRLFGAIVASAVVAVGAVVVAATEPIHSEAGSTMQTGATEIATTPPTEPAIGRAVPVITGPAPLPTEEQGLPG